MRIIMDLNEWERVANLGDVILSGEEWAAVKDLMETANAVVDREIRDGNGGFMTLRHYARRVKAMAERSTDGNKNP